MNSFYTLSELNQLGIETYGNNILVSRLASFYPKSPIKIGDNVRIDDFCILSGDITIGNNVHISAGTKLYGGSGIEIQDYAGCSADCIIYSDTDDFSGEFMVGSMAPQQARNVISGKVVLEKYSQLGAKTIVLPNIIISEGAVTGAFAFVRQNLNPWSINVGIPCREVKKRSKALLNLLPKA